MDISLFFFLLKVTNTFVLPSWPRLGLVRRPLVRCQWWQYDVSATKCDFHPAPSRNREQSWSSRRCGQENCVCVGSVLLWFYRHECRQAKLPRNAELQGSRKQCTTNNQIMHVNTEEPPLLFLSLRLKLLVKLVAERLAIWM